MVERPLVSDVHESWHAVDNQNKILLYLVILYAKMIKYHFVSKILKDYYYEFFNFLAFGAMDIYKEAVGKFWSSIHIHVGIDDRQCKQIRFLGFCQLDDR